MTTFYDDFKLLLKFIFIYVQLGFTLGIIFFFIPIMWVFGDSSKGALPPSAVAAVGVVTSIILGIILMSIHEGRMFFKGYIMGALITLLPFGLFILFLPQIKGNDWIGLTLLIIGLGFSIYEGIMAAADPDGHAILGRMLRDGFNTGIPGLLRRTIFHKPATTSIDTGATSEDMGCITKKKRKKKHVPSNISERLKKAPILHIPPTADETSIPNPDGLTYKTSDGHIVRSKAEMLIDNWFTSHNIQHYYEKPIPSTKFFCDFYLPEHDLYVEYWGRLDNPGYNEQAQKKIRKYEELKLKWVGIIDNDIQNLDSALSEKIFMNTAVEKEETDKIQEHKKEENFWE